MPHVKYIRHNQHIWVPGTAANKALSIQGRHQLSGKRLTECGEYVNITFYKTIYEKCDRCDILANIYDTHD